MEKFKTNKWNPLTFAVFNGNLELIKHILSISMTNTKKLLKIPGMFNTQQLRWLFPFIVALQKGNQELFTYFWEDLSYLWNEDTFDILFKLLAKKDCSDYVTFLFRSKTT